MSSISKKDTKYPENKSDWNDTVSSIPAETKSDIPEPSPEKSSSVNIKNIEAFSAEILDITERGNIEENAGKIILIKDDVILAAKNENTEIQAFVEKVFAASISSIAANSSVEQKGEWIAPIIDAAIQTAKQEEMEIEDFMGNLFSLSISDIADEWSAEQKAQWMKPLSEEIARTAKEENIDLNTFLGNTFSIAISIIAARWPVEKKADWVNAIKNTAIDAAKKEGLDVEQFTGEILTAIMFYLMQNMEMTDNSDEQMTVVYGWFRHLIENGVITERSLVRNQLLYDFTDIYGDLVIRLSSDRKTDLDTLGMKITAIENRNWRETFAFSFYSEHLISLEDGVPDVNEKEELLDLSLDYAEKILNQSAFENLRNDYLTAATEKWLYRSEYN